MSFLDLCFFEKAPKFLESLFWTWPDDPASVCLTWPWYWYKGNYDI